MGIDFKKKYLKYKKKYLDIKKIYGGSGMEVESNDGGNGEPEEPEEKKETTEEMLRRNLLELRDLVNAASPKYIDEQILNTLQKLQSLEEILAENNTKVIKIANKVSEIENRLSNLIYEIVELKQNNSNKEPQQSDRLPKSVAQMFKEEQRFKKEQEMENPTKRIRT